MEEYSVAAQVCRVPSQFAHALSWMVTACL